MSEFRKTLRDGRTVTMTPEPAGRWVTVLIDGKFIDNAGLDPVTPGPKVPAGYTMRAGPVLLTGEEAAPVEAAMKAARTAWAQSPDGLASRREFLAHMLRSATHGEADDRAAAVDNDNLMGYMHGGNAAGEARIAEAEQALDAFDAEHPEIVAALRAEREADVIRWAAQ